MWHENDGYVMFYDNCVMMKQLSRLSNVGKYYIILLAVLLSKNPATKAFQAIFLS